MSIENRQETETRLIEALLSALDAREAAKLSGSAMLVYLADMLVQRTREELDALKSGSGLQLSSAATRPPPVSARTRAQPNP